MGQEKAHDEATTKPPPSVLDNRRIGFFGGGAMAGALVRGLLHSKSVAPDQIRASDVKPARLAELAGEFGIETTADNAALVGWSNVLVVAVKPQIVDRVLPVIAANLSPQTIVISIAAGIPIDMFESALPAGARVVRSMPNTAAIALAGATGIAAGTHASAEDMAVAQALFEAVGRCAVPICRGT